jgi:hypothetical protein
MIETDKYKSELVSFYAKKLNHLVDSRIPPRILEVGINYGGFLEFLSTFFSGRVKLFGIDIIPEMCQFKGGTIIKADQSSKTQMLNAARIVDGLDVVIDDGCHQLDPILITLKAFWPQLYSGGLYFIEDWSAYLTYESRFQSLKDLIPELSRMLPNLGIQQFEVYFNENYSVIMLKKA